MVLLNNNKSHTYVHIPLIVYDGGSDEPADCWLVSILLAIFDLFARTITHVHVGTMICEYFTLHADTAGLFMRITIRITVTGMYTKRSARVAGLIHTESWYIRQHASQVENASTRSKQPSHQYNNIHTLLETAVTIYVFDNSDVRRARDYTLQLWDTQQSHWQQTGNKHRSLYYSFESVMVHKTNGSHNNKIWARARPRYGNNSFVRPSFFNGCSILELEAKRRVT